MPTATAHTLSDKRRNAEISTVSQILRRLSGEMTVTAEGEGVSRAEALARNLWELALTKQVQLSTGEIVHVTVGEWLEVVFRVIERMEGKPMQAISAEVNQGLVLNRMPRMEGAPAMDSVDVAISQLTADPYTRFDGTMR